jgi:hypothetical protein
MQHTCDWLTKTNVLSLDVCMHISLGVGVGQRINELQAHLERLSGIQLWRE